MLLAKSEFVDPADDVLWLIPYLVPIVFVTVMVVVVLGWFVLTRRPRPRKIPNDHAW